METPIVKFEKERWTSEHYEWLIIVVIGLFGLFDFFIN